MKQLQDRVAIVTGSNSGLGRAIAESFAAEGAKVVLAARRKEALDEVAAGIKAKGGVALAVPTDVTKEAEVIALFKKALDAFSRVDILVNNAGIAESATLVTTSDDLWARHLAINLSGTFYCTRATLPAMLEKKWGRVINVASIAGKAGAPYISAYAASKHGVMGLTRSAALEVATSGITVNAICPGYVDTDMVTRGVERVTTRTGRSADEALEAIKKMSPQNRIATAEEVAAVALLLASEEGRGINGQGINIDGGSVFY